VDILGTGLRTDSGGLAVGPTPVGDASDTPATRSPLRTVLLLGAIVLALLVPLLTALVVLRGEHWYPNLDLAATEIRVRDVFTHDSPLIGLYSRVGLGNSGSHPGPLSFYALWPVWMLFGQSPFGLTAGTVVLDAVAIGLCIWLVHRRGGLGLTIGFAFVLVVLMRAYGAFLLTLAWNPYLPVLWWMVFLVAAWSLLADDFVAFPVAILAGTMCVQTHITYAGSVGGLAAFATAVVIYRGLRHGDAASRQRLVRWLLVAAVLFVVLWIPPAIDQTTRTPGNVSTTIEYFRDPPQAAIGLSRGARVLLSQMDPIKLFTRTLVHDRLPPRASGSWVPAAVLVLLWCGSVVATRRVRHRTLLQLDLLLGVALALGLVTASRIVGEVFFYLLLWAWALAALMLLAIGWTIVELVRPHIVEAARPTVERIAAFGLIAITVVWIAVFVSSATQIEVQSPHMSASLRALTRPTAQALERLKADGQAGPYLLTWNPDPVEIGAQGYGLFNELDRRGFDVRSDARLGRHVPMTASDYVIQRERAPVEVHLATGPRNIALWHADRRFRQVAYSDPRSASERAEYDRLRTRLIRVLRRTGHADQVPMVDDNLFLLFYSPGVTPRARDLVGRMIALDMPSAVFVGPPSARS
jgi:hypothetical protein